MIAEDFPPPSLHNIWLGHRRELMRDPLFRCMEDNILIRMVHDHLDQQKIDRDKQNELLQTIEDKMIDEHVDQWLEFPPNPSNPVPYRL